jgi:tetratricopeptide (TPR) repeat protein
VSPKAAPKAAPRLDPDELAALEEQRDFLLASLADLDREHAAGDLDDADHAALRDEYTARAAEVLRAIEQQRSAFAEARRPRSLRRTVGLSAAVVVFALLAGVVAANAMGARKAGESASGGVSVQDTPSQRANECSSRMGTDPDGAFSCLEGVLEDDPENAVALTWSAWILSLSANSFEEPDRTLAQADAAIRLERAVESDPDYSFARAFRAVVAYRNGRYAEAQQYLREFEENDPSAQAQQVILQQGLEADIEAALAEEASSSSTTTSTTTPG